MRGTVHIDLTRDDDTFDLTVDVYVPLRMVPWDQPEVIVGAASCAGVELMGAAFEEFVVSLTGNEWTTIEERGIETLGEQRAEDMAVAG